MADVLAAPEPSWAGILSAIAGVITACSPIILLLILRHTRATDRKVDGLTQVTQEIRIQTDGALTAALRSEIEAVEAQAVAMRRPSPDTQAAIRAIESRLVTMRKALADREAAHQLIIANGATDEKGRNGG